MSNIKTWVQRCELHPAHNGIVTHEMVRGRMQEEIDELRAAMEADAFLLELGNDTAARLVKERDELCDVLRRNGFVKCDLQACNCGSWHARRGLPERMEEIKNALSDAGHPLCNENNNLALSALVNLVKERDELRAKLEALDSA